MTTHIFKQLIEKWQHRLTIFILLIAITPLAMANELEKIGFSTLPGNRVQINLNFTSTAPQPVSFTTDNPARIVLDFPGATLNLNKKSQPVGIGVVQSTTAAQTSDRTRVVLNLVRMVPYNVEVNNNRVLLSIENAAALSASPTTESSLKATPTPPPAKPSPTPTAESAPPPAPIPAPASPTPQEIIPTGEDYVQDIDFHRTPEGTGRIVITLSQPNIVVNTYEEGSNIVLDFLNTSLPAKLDKRLEVTDFGTPINLIDTTKEGNNVRMKITATGNYEYFASQTENRYTLEVQKKIEIKQQEVKIEERKYEGQLVSFNFQNIEVRAALALLFDLPGVNLNMVATDEVTGNITLRLKKIPWDQALDIILEARGLGQRRIGNVVMIDLKEKLDARKQKELQAAQTIKELEPLRTEFITVNYAKAKDFEALLRTKGEHSFLSARGNVSMDERTNTLIVLDTAAKLVEIRGLINSLDTPVRQVLIESRVVLASDDFSKKLGVKFGYSGNKDVGGGTGIILGGKLAGDTKFSGGTAFSGDNTAGGASGMENFLVSLPISGAAGALGLAIGKIGSYLLQLELAAAESEGASRIISNPRVITGNQKKAIILQGSEIPYRTIENNSAKTEFKNAVLSLEVTPQITPDDRIIMELKVKSDKIGQATPDGNLTIDRREVETNVLVDNGETVVLGGVYEQESLDSITRVPFFADLPLVGELFKSTTRTTSQKELLIFVTPKIIKETT